MSPSFLTRTVPTKPDVDALMVRFGEPLEGSLIHYDDVEAVIGCKRRTFRFKTVVSAWRKRLYREHNALMDCEAGKGFVRLDPNSRVEFGARKIGAGVKRVKYGASVINLTDRDRMTPENRKTADHAQAFHAAVQLAKATEAKKIKLPGME